MSSLNNSTILDTLTKSSLLSEKSFSEERWNTFRSDLQSKLPKDIFLIIDKHLQSIQSLKRKEAELNFSAKTLELIQQLNVDISSLAPLDDTLLMSVSKLRSISKADVSLIALLSSNSKDIMRVRVLSGTRTDSLLNFEQNLGSGISGLVAKTKKPYVISDFNQEKDLIDPLARALIEQEEIRSVIGAPLLVNNKFIGIVFLARRQPYSSSEVLLKMLTNYCYQTAVAIDNARLYATELRTSTLHKEIFEETLNYGFSGIVQRLSNIINEPVLLMDELGNVIQNLLPTEYKDIKNTLDHSLIYEKILSRKKSLRKRTELYINKDLLLTVFPVLLLDLPAAYLIIPRSFEQGYPLDIVAIELSKNVLALKLSQERTSTEVELRLRQDYLYDLVLGLESEEDLLRRGRYLKISFRSTRQILVLSQTNFSRNGDIENKQVTQALEKIRYTLGISILPLSMVHGHKLIVIIPSSKTQSVAKDILSYFHMYAPTFDPIIGVSNLVNQPSDYARGYKEANKAAKFAQLLDKSNQIVRYEDLGIVGILFEADNFQSMKDYKERYLGALIEYDSKNKADLIKSLQIFLDNESAIQTSADKLHVHYNTLRYRLNRIKEISGLDLSDPQDRLNIQVSLTIYQLLKSKI